MRSLGYPEDGGILPQQYMVPCCGNRKCQWRTPRSCRVHRSANESI